MTHRSLAASLLALSLLAPVALSSQSFARSFGEPCKANEIEDAASLQCVPFAQNGAETQGLIVKQKVYATQSVPHEFSDSKSRSDLNN